MCARIMSTGRRMNNMNKVKLQQCESCRSLENQLVQQEAVLEWIEDILAGREVSEFALSFPVVLQIHDLVKSWEGKQWSE